MENEKEYISYMRKMIGHKRMMSVGLGCLIIDEKERVLLEKRTDNGKYCLPGGSINFDETVLEGLKREIKEETDIEIKEARLLMISSGKKQELIYPNGDVTDYVDLIFVSHVRSDEIHMRIADGESSLLKFYSFDELPPEEEMLRGTYAPLMKYHLGNLDVVVD